MANNNRPEFSRVHTYSANSATSLEDVVEGRAVLPQDASPRLTIGSRFPDYFVRVVFEHEATATKSSTPQRHLISATVSLSPAETAFVFISSQPIVTSGKLSNAPKLPVLSRQRRRLLSEQAGVVLRELMPGFLEDLDKAPNRVELDHIARTLLERCSTEFDITDVKPFHRSGLTLERIAEPQGKMPSIKAEWHRFVKGFGY
jgi:hypothetical protein